MFNIVINDNSSPLDGRPFRKLDKETFSLNRMIYKSLGSTIYNKNLDPNNVPKNIVGDFINELQMLNDGPTVDPDLVFIDNYFGSLGISVQYPLKKDRIDVANKLSYGHESGYVGPIYEGRKK